MKQTAVKISLQRLLVLHSDYINELHNRTPETRGTYERSLREFLRWIQTEPNFVFSQSDVEQYKRYLENKRKFSNASLMTYMTSLRQFCNFLITKGLLTENPAKHVKAGKFQPQHTRKTLTPQQITLLLQTIERSDERGFRDFAIIKTMVGCGLSEIELIRANVGDVSLQRNKMQIVVQGKGKKKKDSVVIFPPDVRDAMKAYLVYRSNADENDPLFMSAGNRTRGARMTSRGIRERINMYLEKAGIKNGEARKITAFSLRHSAIKMMIEKGAGIEEIQKRFRIERLTTAKRYLPESVNKEITISNQRGD